jgi:hypothetical protein
MLVEEMKFERKKKKTKTKEEAECENNRRQRWKRIALYAPVQVQVQKSEVVLLHEQSIGRATCWEGGAGGGAGGALRGKAGRCRTGQWRWRWERNQRPGVPIQLLGTWGRELSDRLSKI